MRDWGILFGKCCIVFDDCGLSWALGVRNCSSGRVVLPCVPSGYGVPDESTWN